MAANMNTLESLLKRLVTHKEINMEEALNWWETLTEEGKSCFPKPKNNKDILRYHLNIAENIQLEYGML